MSQEGPGNEQLPFLTKVVDVFLRGDVAILLVIVSLLLGVAALLLTPREEDPQIVVPMADILVSAPGLSALEVEEQVATRLERLAIQIDGVEYVYSMSQPGRCVVTVRFFVGEDREDSLIKLYNKIHSNTDLIPPVVDSWVIKPIEIDDVPIVVATLWAEDTARYDDHSLRRIAEQLRHELQALPNTNQVSIVGGRPRRIRVELDPQRLAARQTSPLDVARAIRAGNVNITSGTFEQQNIEAVVEAGPFLNSADDVANLVVRVAGDRPVYIRDVANVVDGPAEMESVSWIGFGPADAGAEPVASRSPAGHVYPAVQIAVAKQKGTNAVHVAESVHQRLAKLAETYLPDGIHYRITRDYGETANEKVNELVEALACRRTDGHRSDRCGTRLATGARDRAGNPRLLQPDPVHQLDCRLHDQPSDDVRVDPVAGPFGRRPDHRRGECRPVLPHATFRPAQIGASRDQRSPAGIDPLDTGDHRQLPAAGFHHGHDGAVHGADGTERAADGDHVDGGCIPDHALAVDGRAAEVARQERGREKKSLI